MRPVTTVLALTFALSAAAPAQSARPGGPLSEPKTWQTPWDKTRPRDPFVDHQGRVWFVGQVGNYVANLDPKTGEFKRYSIEALRGFVWVIFEDFSFAEAVAGCRSGS